MSLSKALYSHFIMTENVDWGLKNQFKQKQAYKLADKSLQSDIVAPIVFICLSVNLPAHFFLLHYCELSGIFDHLFFIVIC